MRNAAASDSPPNLAQNKQPKGGGRGWGCSGKFVLGVQEERNRKKWGKKIQFCAVLQKQKFNNVAEGGEGEGA